MRILVERKYVEMNTVWNLFWGNYYVIFSISCSGLKDLNYKEQRLFF